MVSAPAFPAAIVVSATGATLDDVIEYYDRGGDPPSAFLGGPKEISPLYRLGRGKVVEGIFGNTDGGSSPATVPRELIIHNSWPQGRRITINGPLIAGLFVGTRASLSFPALR